MLIDVSHAPYVFIKAEVESNVPVEEQFQKLLDNGQPFVLITNHGQDDHEDETVEERREKALFFKRIKDRLSKLCRGMIILAGDRAPPAPARLLATTAGKAFGFTVAFASSKDDAIRQGKVLLANHQ